MRPLAEQGLHTKGKDFLDPMKNVRKNAQWGGFLHHPDAADAFLLARTLVQSTVIHLGFGKLIWMLCGQTSYFEFWKKKFNLCTIQDLLQFVWVLCSDRAMNVGFMSFCFLLLCSKNFITHQEVCCKSHILL